MRQGGGQFAEAGHPVHVGKFRLYLPQTLSLLFCTFEVRDVYRRAHELNNISGAIQDRMPSGTRVSNRSVREDDSVLDLVLRLLRRCIAHGFIYPFAILWVHSFQEHCARRWTLLGVKTTDPEHFVGPVKRLLCRRVIGPTASM